MSTPCDLCGSSASFVLFERARDDEKVTNVVCANCGLVYVDNPRDLEGATRSQYAQGEFSLKARGSRHPSRQKRLHSERAALARFRLLASTVDLRKLPNGTLLEIGCGLGSFLRLMRGAGWDVVGLEPDPVYAHVGEQWYGLTIHSQFYEEVLWPEGHFDMVASFHVLEHVDSPRRLLQKVASEIKPGGLLYLETPCIERPYGGDLERFFWSSHLFTFSRNTLSGLLRLTGFDVIQSSFVGDFLWVLAKRTEGLPSNMQIQVPLDDPRHVLQHTHRARKVFLSLKAIGVRPGLVRQVTELPVRAAHKLRSQPDDFLPAIARRSEALTANLARRFKVDVKSRGGKYIAHFGLHTPSNAGDTSLFVSVRKLIDTVIGRQVWSLEPLWDQVTSGTVNRLNAASRGILIGGGGVLLRDTNPNSNSGWQWNCSLDLLQRLEVPIVVFAIGYNRFRDQDEFEPVFQSHIQEMVRRSVFFGLRNHGSVAQLSRYLDDASASKLTFQPCPTTLLRYLYPQYSSRLATTRDTPSIAFNAAFDRSALRFGRREDEVLTSVARTMKWVNQQGWQVILVNHCPEDAAIVPWLVREDVTFEEVSLAGRSQERILAFYQGMSLVVGMRGHSQMIPFGLGVPIVSLISHEKLGYFLEDIGHPEWGLDVQETALEDKLVEQIKSMVRDQASVHEQILQAQSLLWDITLENLESIRSSLRI